jgi:N-acetylneuraminate synthase
VPLSIEPDELAALVKGSRAIWEARGGAKDVLPEEKPVIDFAYACVVTIRPVGRGETFSLDNTWVKRPGNGPLLANQLPTVLGRAAARDLAAGVQIAPTDLA